MTGPLLSAVAAALAVWLVVPDASLRRLSRGSRRRGMPAWLEEMRGQFVTRAERARRARIEQRAAMVCDLLAVCIEAGRPPRGALRAVGSAVDEPTRSVLSGVWNQIELGVDESAAWASLSEQPGYRTVGRGMARSLHSGAASASLLRGQAQEARAVAATAAQARARRVAVSGVLPLVVCFLPAFLLVGIVPIFGGALAQFLGW